MYIRKFFVCSTNHIIRPYSLKTFFNKHLQSELFYLMSGLSLVLVVTYSKADFVFRYLILLFHVVLFFWVGKAVSP